eukprot:201468-Chlamydomonas_euryale.AAC.3
MHGFRSSAASTGNVLRQSEPKGVSVSLPCSTRLRNTGVRSFQPAEEKQARVHQRQVACLLQRSCTTSLTPATRLARLLHGSCMALAHGSCTPLAHGSCTPLARPLPAPCTPLAPPLHAPCTPLACPLHAPCTPLARLLHAPCTALARPLHGSCTALARLLHGPCTALARLARAPVCARVLRSLLRNVSNSGVA